MLFTGPALSGATAQTDTAREPALQDPPYLSRPDTPRPAGRPRPPDAGTVGLVVHDCAE